MSWFSFFRSSKDDRVTNRHDAETDGSAPPHAPSTLARSQQPPLPPPGSEPRASRLVPPHPPSASSVGSDDWWSPPSTRPLESGLPQSTTGEIGKVLFTLDLTSRNRNSQVSGQPRDPRRHEHAQASNAGQIRCHTHARAPRLHTSPKPRNTTHSHSMNKSFKLIREPNCSS